MASDNHTTKIHWRKALTLPRWWFFLAGALGYAVLTRLCERGHL